MSRFHNSSFIILTCLLFSLPALAGPPGAPGDLYVPFGGKVVQFDGTSGALVGDFVPQGSGGLIFGRGLDFGPNGNLFVLSGSPIARVLEYDGSTGAFVGEFVAPGSGGLGHGRALLFRSNGNLLVATDGAANTHFINEYDGITGAFVGLFVDLGSTSSGVVPGEGLTFGPNGNLFVSDSNCGCCYAHSRICARNLADGLSNSDAEREPEPRARECRVVGEHPVSAAVLHVRVPERRDLASEVGQVVGLPRPPRPFDHPGKFGDLLEDLDLLREDEGVGVDTVRVGHRDSLLSRPTLADRRRLSNMARTAC